MNNEQLSIIDILVKTHEDLDRQGPGSSEMTTRALSFLGDLSKISRVADLGCGTGGQTMILAQNITGSIIAVDQFPQFIDILNNNAKKLSLEDKVQGIIGNVETLSFEKEEFDLIWSEGVIDSIGFEKGLSHWSNFLKKNGYVALTCPSWLTDEHPAEVEKFWIDAGSGLDTIANNIGVMQKTGYGLIAAFTLPENCWTEHYFIPRQAAEKALLEKYPRNKTLEEYIQGGKYEVELYSKYSQHYGYVFYIGKKVR